MALTETMIHVGEVVILRRQCECFKYRSIMITVPSLRLDIHVAVSPTKVMTCSLMNSIFSPALGPGCVLYKTVHLPGHAPVHILGFCAVQPNACSMQIVFLRALVALDLNQLVISLRL